MDYQVLFNITLAGVSILFGWVVKTMHEAMRDLQAADAALVTKVQSIEVLVAGEYVKRGELEHMAEMLFAKLDRIESKLDNKADKAHPAVHDR